MTAMPFKAIAVYDNNALPVYAHLPQRNGLVQRFLSLVERGLTSVIWSS